MTTTVARLLRGLLPAAAAGAVMTAAGLPAAAAPLSPAAMSPAAQSPAAQSPAAISPAAQSSRSAEWWLSALHIPAALEGSSAAGRGVTVAVLSTGVAASHPDLAGTVITGPDLSPSGRKPGGPYWGAEGTAVASLIAGHGHGAGRNEGITGVAPGARILPVQVTLEYDDPLNADAAITRRLPAAIAAGIRYAVGHGATVIALPLDPGALGPAGDPAAAGGSTAERAAVSFALAHGVLLVAPAGDNGAGTNAVNYPAAYRGVIAVGATAQDGRLAPFSGAHSYVAVTAPGSGDTPAVPVSGGTAADPAAGLTVAAADGGYQSLASTDMSAGLTAGVAALIRSRYPRLTVAEDALALERGATEPNGTGPPPPASGRGQGGLNATAALTAASGIAAQHPAPSASPATPTPAVSAPPAGTGPTVAVPQAAPVSPDPGHLLRTLVTGLAIAAGVLIACLIGAITLTRLRRRKRARSATGPAGTARPGAGARPARHARGQSAAAPPPAAPPAGPSAAPLPAGTRAAGWFAGPPPRPPGNDQQAVSWPAGPRQRLAQHQPPDVSWPPGQTRPEPVDEQPPDVVWLTDAPWPPAAPPGTRVTPDSFLPAEPGVQAEAPLAPWEKSPADFPATTVPDERTPWPVSTTGPMYVWNPAATTGPLGIAGSDAEDDAPDDAGD